MTAEIQARQDPQYSDLPFAKIGKHAWVPLEMLEVAHTQSISAPRNQLVVLENIDRVREGPDFRAKESQMKVLGNEFTQKICSRPEVSCTYIVSRRVY